MNKSLLLVMCDVLVLAALSLSTGGFDENENCDESVESGVMPFVDLEGLQAELRKARAAADSARKDQETAAADAARAIAGQLDAEAKAARAEAAAAAAQAAANDAEKARKDAEEKASKAREEAAAAREEAAAAKEGEMRAKSEAETAKANEAHAKTEAEKAKAGLARAEKDKAAAEAEATAAEKDKTAAEAAAAAAEKARIEVDERFVKPALARQERIDRIHATACLVVVKFGKGKEDRFYSPVVDIDGEAYVMARYDGDRLALINSVSVQDRRTAATTCSREAYYLLENRQLDIVFFKLNTSVFSSRLTLGENSSETLQYWISRKSGDVKRAALVQPGLRQAASDYKTIEPGDVLVDSGTASIVCLALSKGTVFDWFNAKGAYGFDHKITYSDLHLWRAL